MHVWTQSLGEKYVSPGEEVFLDWLSQELYLFLQGTRIAKLPPVLSRKKSLHFTQDSFSSSAQDSFDDLHKYFHAFYTSRFAKMPKIRTSFEEYYIKGMTINEIEIAHSYISNNAKVNLRAALLILQDNVLGFSEKKSPSLPKKDAPSKHEIVTHDTTSSGVLQPMLPIVSNDFNLFHQKLGVKFNSLSEDARSRDPYSIIHSCLDKLSSRKVDQLVQFRNLLFTKKDLSKGPTWYKAFLTRLYEGISKDGTIVCPDKALFAPVKPALLEKGEEHYKETFIPGCFRVINNIIYPLSFPSTEEAWKNKDSLLVDW